MDKRETDERFMQEALAEARLAAAEGEVPIGAVVVHDGAVIARAHNRRERDEDPSAHAEFSAMLQAARKLGRWRLHGCTVYVTLEPCLMCAGLMVNARIDRCVYGAADPKGGALGTLYNVSDDARLNHAFEVVSGVCEGACAEVLQAFFADLRERRRGKVGTGAAGTLPAEGGDVAASACSVGGTGVLAAGGVAPSDGMAAGGGVLAASRRRAPHVVLAVDSFKGSVSSAQAEAWLAEGLRRVAPKAEITLLPMADGGEGTLDAIAGALGGSMRTAEVSGADGRSCFARWLHVDGAADTVPAADAVPAAKAIKRPAASTAEDPAVPAAVIEAAEVIGLGGLRPTHEEALVATSRGLGELLLHAVSQGARNIYIALGGSCTNDGGAGLLQVLGARLLDAAGRPAPPGLRGLRDVASVDLAPACRALEGVRITVLGDVKNPLVGPRGALRVFGIQKGLADGMGESEREAALATCDRWMAAYASRLTAARDALDGTAWQVGEPGKRPKSLAGVPGAGAAGGLGAALLALGARLVPGIDAVLDLVGFDAAIRCADAVITGEGRLDAQTAAGKVPVGVARRAKRVRSDCAVVAVCGGRSDDIEDVYEQGVDVVMPILRRPMPLEQAMAEGETRRNLVCAGETVGRMLLFACSSASTSKCAEMGQMRIQTCK